MKLMVFDLSLEGIRKMPLKHQAMVIGFLYLLLAAAYYVTFLQASFEKKVSLQKKLSEIQQQVTEKELFAIQKNRNMQALNERQTSFGMALTKLPNEREIPELLHDVAQAGREAGVDLMLFEPGKTVKKPLGKDIKSPDKKDQDAKKAVKPEGSGFSTTGADENFYEEIPVNVKIKGSFQNTAHFFENVARLSRIINIEELSMSEAKDAKGQGRVVHTSCVIKTYMFQEKTGGKKIDDKK
jgi:type IV pilus assembly protein PilO